MRYCKGSWPGENGHCRQYCIRSQSIRAALKIMVREYDPN